MLTPTFTAAAAGAQGAPVREITLTSRYLYLPISSGARQRTVHLAVEGKEFLTLPVEVADGKPHWWGSIDVSAYAGKTVRISLDHLPAGSTFLEQIGQGDAPVKDATDLYREPLRPLAHFTAARGWLNDPNGPIYLNGTYHLFFQLDPVTYHGNIKYWGHATSSDLVHWAEHTPAIVPGPAGSVDPSIWSGSAVLDRNNTSGLGTRDNPPLVLFYTAAGNPFTQCLAYSLDGGKTFTKYARNPVVPNIRTDNRDPRVLWHEPSKKWVMVLWVKAAAGDGKPERDVIQFLTSPNLLDWTPTSQTEGYFECPDLIPLPNSKGETMWVLTAANATYQVGSFDGGTFHPTTPILPGAVGGAYYAPQTFTDAPDGRTLQIGWLRGDIPGMPFNQQMSVVHDLALVDTPDGPRLTRRPVKELAVLRQTTTSHAGKTFPPGDHFLGDLDSEAVELRVDFAPADKSQVEFNVHGINVSYDTEKQELAIGNTRTKAPLINGRQRLTLYLDRTCIEAFASDGQVYLPMVLFPQKHRQSLSLTISHHPVTFDTFEVHALGSMWSKSQHH